MRQITPDDFDAVYDIYMDESVNPFMAHDPMPKSEFKKVFEGLIKRDHFWLFDHEGRAVGMASVVRGVGRCAHVATILSLGVKKECQGMGFGKAIMRQMTDFLVKNGIKRVELGAEADNERGLAFYKKLGFQVDGVMPKYLKRRADNHYVDEVLFSIVYD